MIRQRESVPVAGGLGAERALRMACTRNQSGTAMNVSSRFPLRTIARSFDMVAVGLSIRCPLNFGKADRWYASKLNQTTCQIRYPGSFNGLRKSKPFSTVIDAAYGTARCVISLTLGATKCLIESIT